MKISEAVKMLQEFENLYGDLEIVGFDLDRNEAPICGFDYYDYPNPHIFVDA